MKPVLSVPAMIKWCLLSAVVAEPLVLMPDAARGQTLILVCSQLQVDTPTTQPKALSKTSIFTFHLNGKKKTVDGIDYVPPMKNGLPIEVTDTSISWENSGKSPYIANISRITGAIIVKFTDNDNLLKTPFTMQGGCHMGEKQF